MVVEEAVFVIAGDSKTRRNLSVRLKQLDRQFRLCRSPEEFQQGSSPQDAGCVLIHLAHVDFDLDWLMTLGRHEDHWPVIAITAEADVESAVLAMKRGAFDFLLETCDDLRLRSAIDEAIRWDAARRKEIAQVQAIRRRMKMLAPPLRDVIALLLDGKSNREIAHALGLCVRAIEARRAKVMKVMRARSLAGLVRQALMAREAGPIFSRSASDIASQDDRGALGISGHSP
jgi:two-component system, LuxR family, response regulator FixJ